MSTSTSAGGSSAQFAATRWSVVLAAAGSDTDSCVRERALTELAQRFQQVSEVKTGVETIVHSQLLADRGTPANFGAANGSARVRASP